MSLCYFCRSCVLIFFFGFLLSWLSWLSVGGWWLLWLCCCCYCRCRCRCRCCCHFCHRHCPCSHCCIVVVVLSVVVYYYFFFVYNAGGVYCTNYTLFFSFNPVRRNDVRSIHTFVSVCVGLCVCTVRLHLILIFCFITIIISIILCYFRITGMRCLTNSGRNVTRQTHHQKKKQKHPYSHTHAHLHIRQKHL